MQPTHIMQGFGRTITENESKSLELQLLFVLIFSLLELNALFAGDGLGFPQIDVNQNKLLRIDPVNEADSKSPNNSDM